MPNDPCVYCASPSQVGDHMDALAVGGADAPSNLTPACARCNMEKSSLTALGYLILRATRRIRRVKRTEFVLTARPAMLRQQATSAEFDDLMSIHEVGRFLPDVTYGQITRRRIADGDVGCRWLHGQRYYLRWWVEAWAAERETVNA